MFSKTEVLNGYLTMFGCTSFYKSTSLIQIATLLYITVSETGLDTGA